MKKNPANVMYLLMIAILLMLAIPAFAGGDDITQSNDMNNQTAGNVHIAGDKGGRALGIAMGDVDIGQCLAHKATLVYTWPTENHFCQAQWLIASGYVEAGEHLMCTKTRMAKVYDDYDRCRAGLVRVIEEPPPPPAAPAEVIERDDEELLARLSALEAQQAKDAELAQQAARRAHRAAQAAEQAEAERREYAQQTLEELEKWK